LKGASVPQTHITIRTPKQATSQLARLNGSRSQWGAARAQHGTQDHDPRVLKTNTKDKGLSTDIPENQNSETEKQKSETRATAKHATDLTKTKNRKQKHLKQRNLQRVLLQSSSTRAFLSLPGSLLAISSKALPRKSAAQPWSAACSQSILKMELFTHGANIKGEIH